MSCRADEHLGCPAQELCSECEATGKVSGRPIRLADVLLAIGQRQKDSETPFNFAIHDSGAIMKWDLRLAEWFNTCIVWNLDADDLEKQSEETITFLYELLK
jgi:hypothetical protein